MKSIILKLIEESLGKLKLSNVLHDDLFPKIHVEHTRDSSHGDFFSNIAMILAKLSQKDPLTLAQKIAENIPNHSAISSICVARPGFINFFQNPDFLALCLMKSLNDKNLGVRKVKPKMRVVVDMSSPNLAKEMHVGHLRSSIIGDSVARVLEFLGDKVIRQNHVGDWGTQFGMLVAFLEESSMTGRLANLSDLEYFYCGAKKRFEESEEFAEYARSVVVKLQKGSDHYLELWSRFRKISLIHCQKIYDLLNVQLSLDDVRGESFYKDDLPSMVDDLHSMDLLVESDGALCVINDGIRNGDNKIFPVIIVKADGGYLYSTTDLSAIRYRIRVLKADRIIYFVDQRQSFHFEQLFFIGRLANFIPPSVQVEHMGFGTMNDAKGRPFKTRDGGIIKLSRLLDEAKERAYEIVKRKNPDLSELDRREIASVIGINAIKYSDLVKNRRSEYRFSFDTMLSFEGNTAPYLMYAYARASSVLRKSGRKIESSENLIIRVEEEKELGNKLYKFNEILNIVSDKGTPHILCNYLYELSGVFSKFYESCPTLSMKNEKVRDSRLSLTFLTSKVLKKGMELLGLKSLERM